MSSTPSPHPLQLRNAPHTIRIPLHTVSPPESTSHRKCKAQRCRNLPDRFMQAIGSPSGRCMQAHIAGRAVCPSALGVNAVLTGRSADDVAKAA